MNMEDVKYWMYVLVSESPIGAGPVVLGIAIAFGTWGLSRGTRFSRTEAGRLQTIGYVLAAILVLLGTINLILAFGGCC